MNVNVNAKFGGGCCRHFLYLLSKCQALHLKFKEMPEAKRGYRIFPNWEIDNFALPLIRGSN